MLNKYRVLLPKWVFKNTQKEQVDMKLLYKYMQVYPHYAVVKIEGHFAICERVERSTRI